MAGEKMSPEQCAWLKARCAILRHSEELMGGPEEIQRLADAVRAAEGAGKTTYERKD